MNQSSNKKAGRLGIKINVPMYWKYWNIVLVNICICSYVAYCRRLLNKAKSSNKYAQQNIYKTIKNPSEKGKTFKSRIVWRWPYLMD